MNRTIPENVRIFETPEELYAAAAEMILVQSCEAILKRGRFVIAFSGGQSPGPLYALLAQEPYRTQISWKNVFVFWGDERCVPLEDKRNNAYQAKSILLDKVEIPSQNIFRIPVDLPPAEAAMEYEKTIFSFFGKEEPRMDLILLGLGENAHTASLFPGTAVLSEKKAGVREVTSDADASARITLTAPLINQALNILFLVTGKSKSEVLRKVFSSAYNPGLLPVQLIAPLNGKIIWFADRSAASAVS